MSTIAAPLDAPATQPAPHGDEEVLRALVERVKADDLGAFDELYRLTRDDVARTLFHLVGRRADLEDLIQETYLKLLSALKTFRGESQVRTFLYRVCANVALMHLRWRFRRREDFTAEPPERVAPGHSPEVEAQRREAQRLVQAALSKLSPKKRVVFVYHELNGMGPEEIARAVGTSPNTVRSRLHHARLEFNAAMQKLIAGKGAPRG